VGKPVTLPARIPGRQTSNFGNAGGISQQQYGNQQREYYNYTNIFLSYPLHKYLFKNNYNLLVKNYMCKILSLCCAFLKF
jgi:hypothetical protein